MYYYYDQDINSRQVSHLFGVVYINRLHKLDAVCIVDYVMLSFMKPSILVQSKRKNQVQRVSLTLAKLIRRLMNVYLPEATREQTC